jgi:hypothetical protein
MGLRQMVTINTREMTGSEKMVSKRGAPGDRGIFSDGGDHAEGGLVEQGSGNQREYEQGDNTHGLQQQPKTGLEPLQQVDNVLAEILIG